MAKIYGGRWRFIKSVREGGQSWVYIVEDTTGEFKGVYVNELDNVIVVEPPQNLDFIPKPRSPVLPRPVQIIPPSHPGCDVARCDELRNPPYQVGLDQERRVTLVRHHDDLDFVAP
jgi:hypothetical protein